MIAPHPRIEDEEIQINSRLLSILLVILLPVAITFLLVMTIGYKTSDLTPDLLVFGSLLILLTGIYWVNRLGHFHIAVIAILILGGIAIFIEALLDKDMGDLAFLLLPMIIASLFLSRKHLLILAGFYISGPVFLLFAFPDIQPGTIVRFIFPLLILGFILNIISRSHRDYLENTRNQKLMASELRYSLSADAVNDGLWDWDFVKNKVYYSSRWKEMIGYEPDEISDSPDEWFTRIHPDDIEAVSLNLRQVFNPGSNETFEIEYRFRHKNGNYIWVLSRGRPNRDDNGNILRTIGSHTDITSRRQAEEKLSFDALHDTLTGLANRALFNEKLNQIIKYAKKDPSLLFAVLFLDLDHFKDINDSMGHEAGDLVLKQFAQRVQSVLFDVDTLARLGGDEFVILLETLDSPQRPINVIRRIKDSINQPFNINVSKIYLTVSIGVVIATWEYNSSDEIMRDADIAMYHAKGKGRDTFEIFNNDMRARILNRLNLERELRQAIYNSEFFLEYQPITNLSTSTLLGFEALIRWNHPDRGVIPPAEFISLAEQTGLIIQIGEWVFRTACIQMKEWEIKYPTTKQLTMSINVSGKQLNHARFYKTVAEILEEIDIKPNRINLEITETVILEDNPETHNALMSLSQQGFKLQLDDFGTGQSSLGYLQKYPLSDIKIDRTFVSHINQKREYGLINGIIQLAKALELNTIAEGIETKEQATALKSLKCDSGQGFGISTPAPGHVIDQFFQKQLSNPSFILPIINFPN